MLQTPLPTSSSNIVITTVIISITIFFITIIMIKVVAANKALQKYQETNTMVSPPYPFPSASTHPQTRPFHASWCYWQQTVVTSTAAGGNDADHPREDAAVAVYRWTTDDIQCRSTAIIELHEAIAFSAAAVNIPIIHRSRRITWSTDSASATMTTSRHTCTYAV